MDNGEMIRRVVVGILVLLSIAIFAVVLFIRSWHYQEMRGMYFNGQIISLGKVSDTENDYNKGGFVQITSSLVSNEIASIKDYVRIIKSDEQDKIKAGGLPIVPGPSQYEYIGVSPKLAPKGFEEVSSLATIGSNTEAHLYWKIENGKLYEIFIKYPDENSKRYGFEFGARIVMDLLKIL